MITKKFQLKNGMKVLFQQSHKSPVVSVQVWVRTGSADEAKGEEGISHFIEHLVFKGTRKFKVGEIAAQIEGAGGELNAYTSFDQTVFYVTMSKHFVDVGIESLAEMMGFPLFDPTEIDNEREVVVEEIKRGEDSLGRKASQLLFSTLYQKHPYGVPVIGFEKNVRGWKAKKIVEYYQSRYSPQNMFLVVAGDFQSDVMKEKVTKAFGEFKAYKFKKVVRKKEPAQKNIRIEVEKSKFEQSICYIGWKTPDVRHKDMPALDVLSMIMGQGDSSRLVHKLRIEDAIVNSIGASVFSSQDPGFLGISMGYNKEKLPMALSKVTEVICDVLAGKIESVEIKKAITNIESENLYGVETVDGLSRKIGDAEFLMHDPHAFEKYLRDVKKVTAKDLHRVAKKYIKTDVLSVIALTNDEAKKSKEHLKKWVKDFKIAVKKTKTSKLSTKKISTGKLVKKSGNKEVKTTVHQLKNGVRILMRPSFETQVISAKVAMLGGGRREAVEHIGISELTSRAWSGGTKTKTEQEIYHQTESLAAGISPLAGRNSIGLGLDCITPFESQARDLFLDILMNPIFPNEVIERERGVQIEQIRTRTDNPAQICVRQFMEMMFGEHPYGRDQMGSEKTLSKIDSAIMTDFWKQHLVTKNMTFMLVGAFDQKKWIEAIEDATNKIDWGTAFKDKMELNYPKKNLVKFHEVKKEQSHLVYGFPGLKLSDEERYTLQIMQSILAGQGGRLFIELRDKNSLAYSVSPVKLEGIDGGYFGAYIGCSPDKVEKALSMMKIEFAKLCNKKVSDSELDRARRYLIGRHDIDLQRAGSVGASILYDDIYGIPYDETFNLSKKYAQITAEKIQAVAQKIFKGTEVISLVGPSNPFKQT